MNIQEIRAKYPQYGDVSDGDLVKSLHTKFYSDMPFQQFEQKVYGTKALKIGAEGLPDAIAQVSKEFGPISKIAIGGAGAVNRMAMRLKQLLGRDLTPQDLQGLKEYEALNDASGAAVGGDIGMSLLATAVPGVGLQAGATNLAARALPAAVARTVGGAAAGAGMAAATTPVTEGQSEIVNAALGAAGGAAGDLVGRVASRVVQPLRQSSEVQKLVKEGIVPTPGQAAGGSSFIGKVEQKLQSLPVVGDIIAKGRTRAVEELNKAALSRSLPNGAKVTEIGRAAMQQADEVFDDAYRLALSNVTVKLGTGIDDAVARVKADPDLFLDEAAEKNLSKVASTIKARFRNGEISGEVAKKIDSQLGSISRKYSSSSTASERDFGAAIRGLQGEFRSMLAEGAGGEKSAVLKELNGKYARFLRVQKASGYVGSKDGVFSANQLQSAVRGMDPSRNKGAFGRGEALMQDLSDPAKAILGDTVPDSGTAGRALLGMGLLGAGGAANEFYGGPGYLTALAAAPLLYSRGGSRYMVGDLPGQQGTSAALGELAPYLSQLGRISALR